MKWHELSEQHCSVARSLAVVGDRWTLMIVRDLFLGATQFEQLRRSLKISRTVLTDRLNLLETEGVVTRRPYQEKPTRYRYLLTTKGMDLYPIIMTLVSDAPTPSARAANMALQIAGKIDPQVASCWANPNRNSG